MAEMVFRQVHIDGPYILSIGKTSEQDIRIYVFFPNIAVINIFIFFVFNVYVAKSIITGEII